MRLDGISIKNVLSYRDARFDFRDYNVVVGPNNSGKTNLLRIMKMLCRRFCVLSLPRESRIDGDMPSQVALDLSATSAELGAILCHLSSADAARAEFPGPCRRLRLYANWDRPGSVGGLPANMQAYLGHGLSAAFDYSGTIVFDADLAPGGPGSVPQQTMHHDLESIGSYMQDGGILYAEGAPDGKGLAKLFLDGTKSEDHFCKDGNPVYYALTYDGMDIPVSDQNIDIVARQIYGKGSYAPDVTFGMMMHAMIKNSVAFVEEIYPSYKDLTEGMFDLKSRDDRLYGLIKSEFAGLFDKAEARVEILPDTNEKTVVINEGRGDVPIKDSASGHYSALHMLRAVLARSDGIVLLDEPETHLHPVKTRQLGSALARASAERGNQVILLTHSPYLVDVSMLYSGRPYALVRVAKEGHASVARGIGPGDDIDLKPHMIDQRMFFGAGSLLVEGYGDKSAMRAISDALGGALDRHSVTIISCMGKGNIDRNIQLHRIFGIPYAGMADHDYAGGDPGVVVLEKDLEHELGKTGWKGDGAKISPDAAYCYVGDMLETKGGLDRMKSTTIWEAFCRALRMVDVDPADLKAAQG